VALLTKDLNNLNAGNTDELYLLQGGGSVQGSNVVLSNLWNQSLLIAANANIILENLDIVADPGNKGGPTGTCCFIQGAGAGKPGHVLGASSHNHRKERCVRDACSSAQ
jgi:hypothetical protein